MSDGPRLEREVQAVAIARVATLATAVLSAAAACANPPQPVRDDGDGRVAAAAGVVVTVALDGSGQYTSVNAALAAAPQGGVVRIGPGTFEERVLVTKPVTIEGAGPDRTTIFSTLTPRERQEAWDECQKEIAAAKSGEERSVLQGRLMVRQTELLRPTMRVTGTQGVVVRGLTLSVIGEHADGGSLPGSVVDAASSGLTIQGCAIVGSPGSGVTVGPGADVTIDGCLVAAIWDTGISVWPQREEPSSVRIAGSDVRNCRHRGIVVGGGNGAVTIEGCRISGSSWHGIRYESASPLVRGNVIFGNVRSGIYASGQTGGRIQGNLFFRNGMGDVSCWYDAKDVIEGNTFVESQREAVAILGASAPVVRKNVFAECGIAIRAGALAGGDERRSEYAGGGTIEGNFFWRSGSSFQKPTADGTGVAEAPLAAGNEVADPQFADAAHRDDSLAAASPSRAAGAGVASPLTFESPWVARPEEAATAPKESPAADPPAPAPRSSASATVVAKSATSGTGAVARAKADILQTDDAARRERGLVAMGDELRSDDPKVALAALCALWDIRDVGYDKERYRPDILRHLASPDFAIGQKAAQAVLRLDRRPGDLDEMLTAAERLPVTPPWMLWAALQMNQKSAEGRLAALFVRALAVDDPEDGAMVTANNLRRMWVSPEVDDAVVAAWRRHPTGRNGPGMWPFVLGQMTSPAQEARVRAVFELMAPGDDAMRQLAAPAVTRPVDDAAKPVAAKLAADAIATAKTASLQRTYLDVIRANGSREQVPMLRALSENAMVGDELRGVARKIADDLERP